MKIEIRYIAIFLLFLLACKKRNECTAPILEQNLVGTWSGHWLSLPDQICEVQFKANKSYTENKDLLMGDYNSPVGTWSAKSDSMEVLIKFDNKNTARYQFSLAENTCDQIVLDLGDTDKLKLVRKK